MKGQAKEKVKNLISALLNSFNEGLSKVKLAKLVLFTEVEYFKNFSTSYTGLYFLKENHGPEIAYFDEVLQEEVGNLWACVEEPLFAYDDDKVAFRRLYYPLKEANVSSELKKVVDLVVQKYGRLPSKALSKLSRDFPAWKYAERYEPIYVAELALKNEDDYFAFLEFIDNVDDDETFELKPQVYDLLSTR